MNVLYCSHTAEFKGGAISLYVLMSNLDRARYNPVAALGKDGGLAGRLAGSGIRTRFFLKKGFLGIGLIREAMRAIAEEKISLVHLNSAMPFCKYIGIAARLKGVPVVWHIREDPEGKRVRRLKKWIGMLSDRIIVVSSDLERCFGPTGRAVKIYNGVGTDSFRPGVDGRPFRERHGIPGDAFVFGIVGTVERRKGTLEFLKAASDAVSGGYRKACFLIVGDGPKEYMDEVSRFVESTPGLKERTVMTGRLADIPEVMAAIDVLVMPSLWEGFPRALIEAMASGRPAIAAGVGEVAQILEDGVSGFVIKKGDGAGLLAAMKKVMDMPEGRLRNMGVKAREKALEFSITKHVEAVQDEYARLV